MIKISEIFSNFLATKVSEVDLKPILEKCLQLEKESEGVKISNVRGWQSNEIDLAFEPFNKLVPDILDVLKNVVEYAQFVPNYTITNAWININRLNCSNLVHTHAGSTVSGVFYINVPKDSGKIKFMNPARVAISSYVRDWEWTGDLSTRPIGEVYQYQPVAGEILLFPSWLEHYVENNYSKEPRVSIAFNIKLDK